MNKNLMIYATATVAYLSQCASAAIVEDGLWTGNDWYDSTHEIGVANGIPYSDNEAVDRRLKAPLTIDGSIEETYLGFVNVQRVQYLFTETDFVEGFPQADPIYTYDNFLRAVAKFPAFCGESNIEGQTLEQTCKRELASIFAHWGQETGKRDPNDGEFWTQGLYWVQEIRCNGTSDPSCAYTQGGWAEDAWPAQPDQQYFGRGPFQLSWNYNYGRFSNVMAPSSYNSKLYLLENPDLVHEDGFLAMAAGIWFYMSPQDPKPSMHDVMTGFFEPNDADLAGSLTATFGTTINIINGGVECVGPTENSKAASRAEYYLKWLDFFGMPAEEGLECGHQISYFPYGGAGDVAGYWAAAWSGVGCRPATYQTAYDISARDDYKRCVCELFGEGEADCPDDGESGESNEGDEGEFTPEPEPEEEPEEETDAITHFQELKEIREDPHYSEDQQSRTLYQVDREMDFIEAKLLEMYIAMQESNLLQ